MSKKTVYFCDSCRSELKICDDEVNKITGIGSIINLYGMSEGYGINGYKLKQQIDNKHLCNQCTKKLRKLLTL